MGRHKVSLRCELLSICIFERLNTVEQGTIGNATVLWIAFDLYLWKIEHSAANRQKAGGAVVNCFRFVSLKDWTQSSRGSSGGTGGCELLSICIFERLNTVFWWIALPNWLLWIAFDLYLWKIEHSLLLRGWLIIFVVNCFRFVSLKDWTQWNFHASFWAIRCELLSICIFERLNTVTLTFPWKKNGLWIAFDLYLWKIEHSNSAVQLLYLIVVNCFRFVSLKDWTQSKEIRKQWSICCELLSICIFERLNTVINPWYWQSHSLWIAFDLYLWKIEHSRIPIYW